MLLKVADGVCIFDDDQKRVLDGYHEADMKLTIQKCLNICKSRKFPFSGVQWQIECYCGNMPSSGFKWAWPEKCNDPCAGDSTQMCGGSMAMNVYKTPSEDPKGACVYDNPAQRVLDGLSIIGAKNMSIETCKQFCFGYKFYGVQGGDQCHCGDFDKNFLPSPELECNMPCNGNSDQFCGGSWRLNVFLNQNASDIVEPLVFEIGANSESILQSSLEELYENEPDTNAVDIENLIHEIYPSSEDDIFMLWSSDNDDSHEGTYLSFTYLNPSYIQYMFMTTQSWRFLGVVKNVIA